MNNRSQTPGLSFDVLKLKYKVIKLRNNLTGILTSILKDVMQEQV